MTTEAQKEANKRFISKRKENGICIRCKHPVAKNSYKAFKMCEEHLAKARERYQRLKNG